MTEIELKKTGIRCWTHYRTSKFLYLLVDITPTEVVLMLVVNYGAGEERKFKRYLHQDFIYLLEEKKALEYYVPTVK